MPRDRIDPGWTSVPRRHQPGLTLCQQVPATLAHDALHYERESYPKAQISVVLQEVNLMSLYNSCLRFTDMKLTQSARTEAQGYYILGRLSTGKLPAD